MRKAPADPTPHVTMGVEEPAVDELVPGREVVDVGDAGDVGEVLGSDPATREAEFDAFVTSAGSALLRTAYLLTGDHASAEDLLQDTLVRVWSRWSRVRAADRPLAYARRVLVTTSVSRWRAARTRTGRERLVAEPPESTGADAADRDDALWQAVLELPPRQRAVMVLAYYEDLTDQDTAEVLGCAVGTVKSQRAKALRTLRLRLAEEDR
jgi:RNA polymerase sigma-70 factor (sigma-E family)